MNSTPQVKGAVTGRFDSSKPNESNCWTLEQERVAHLLAVELHRQYRAAEKALNGPDKTDTKPALKDGVTLRHDHGWEGCHKQAYFVRRAATVIKRAACQKPETLGEAEQALDAAILIRRLVVEGKLPAPETFADGGVVPARQSFLVGEHFTDATDYVSDATKKAIRDAQVRMALSVNSKYSFRTIFKQPATGQPLDRPRVEIRTNAVAGSTPFRGVR